MCSHSPPVVEGFTALRARKLFTTVHVALVHVGLQHPRANKGHGALDTMEQPSLVRTLMVVVVVLQGPRLARPQLGAGLALGVSTSIPFD